MRFILIILLVLVAYVLKAQTLGGGTAYQFLKLPAAPMLSASGGANVSYSTNDIGLALNNPALLSDQVHAQLGLAFNSYFAGIKAYHLAGAYQATDWNTTIGGSIFFIDYGNTPQTNASGNVEGAFRPRDYVLQLAASQRYLEKWKYGLSVKLIRSEYGAFRSTGIAADVGVLFLDTTAQLSASVLAKNMGVQLSAYHGQREDLPFDLQVGVTKRLANSPLGFSVTMQQIHRYDLTHHDTTFNIPAGSSAGSSFLANLFNHLVIGSHLYLGNHLEVSVGYNRLRRMELNLGSSGNGINGFSAGFNVKFRKFHLQYARAYYQRSSAYNQFGLTVHLKEMGALGSL